MDLSKYVNANISNMKFSSNEILPSCQVTEANKREYVKLYVNYRWCHGIEQQFLALHKGFHEVVPPHHLKPFDERELELVIGRKKVDCNRGPRSGH